MKMYVGNLSHDVTEAELRKEFEAFGKVTSVSIVTDRISGTPRGFAFVEMPTISEGQAAIAALSGKMLKERTLVVNPARAPEDRGVASYGDRRNSRFGGGRRGRY